MNVHYLELFYYVAKYEGITRAVRKMPYGIQQPAVSAQLLKLEEELSAKLFQRRPFLLTDAGRTLYQFIEPFFSKLPRVVSQLQGEADQHLRLGASQTVLAHYLPILMQQLRKELPNVRLTLVQVSAAEAETMLLAEEIDIAVTILHGRSAPGLRAIDLIQIPIVLLSHHNTAAESFEKLLEEAENKSLTHPLISLPPGEPITQLFQKELERRRYSWEPHITVNQLELVQSYAAEGFGYGIYAEVPGLRPRKNLVKIPLPDFPELTIGCLHRGHVNAVGQHFLDSAQQFAARIV